MICLDGTDQVPFAALDRVWVDGRIERLDGNGDQPVDVVIEASDARALRGGGFRYLRRHDPSSSDSRTERVILRPDGSEEVEAGGAGRIILLGGRSLHDPTSRDGRLRVERNDPEAPNLRVTLYDLTAERDGAYPCEGRWESGSGCRPLAHFTEGSPWQSGRRPFLAPDGSRFGISAMSSAGRVVTWLMEAPFEGEPLRFDGLGTVLAGSESYEHIVAGPGSIPTRVSVGTWRERHPVDVEEVVSVAVDPCGRFALLIVSDEERRWLVRAEMSDGSHRRLRELPSWVDTLELSPDGGVVVGFVDPMPGRTDRRAWIASPFGGEAIEIRLPPDTERVSYAPELP